MKNMNYTNDVEYETTNKKKFQITRGMVILAIALLIIIIVIIILISNISRTPKQEYTIEDFNSLEERMILEAPNYVVQKQITLTEEDTKIDLKNLLIENGGPIDPSKQKAAQVCKGYVIARKEETEKYFAYIKCEDMFTSYGYVSNEEDVKLTTTTTIKKDIAKPNITLIGEKEINVYVGEKFNDPGATAIDNVDGNITSNIEISGSVNTNLSGTYNLTYSVSDKAGNTAKVKRTVNVISKITTTKEQVNQTTNKTTTKNKQTTKKTTQKTTSKRPTTSPTITLYGNKTITLYVGDNYSDPGYSAVDSLGINITPNVNVSQNVNTGIAGTYYVNYSVIDNYGNKASVNRIVIVKQKLIALKSISISPNTLELSVNSTKKLDVFYTPSNATDKSISWSSSNSDVAMVINGYVYGKARGNAIITAKSSNGKIATTKVTVK